MGTGKSKGTIMKAKWALSELSGEQKRELRESFMAEYNCSRPTSFLKIGPSADLSELNPSERKWLTSELAEMLNEKDLELNFDK